MMKVPSFKFQVCGQGFTLIEVIVYLAIVGIILTSISYLILDILGGQTKSNAQAEINYNLRFITNTLTKDIRAARDINSLSSDTLVLLMPASIITYNFDPINKKITRQVDSGSYFDVSSKEVEVSGSFSNLSYLSRTKNVSVNLTAVYKNPTSLPDYNASTTAEFAVELRGRR